MSAVHSRHASENGGRRKDVEDANRGRDGCARGHALGKSCEKSGPSMARVHLRGPRRTALYARRSAGTPSGDRDRSASAWSSLPRPRSARRQFASTAISKGDRRAAYGGRRTWDVQAILKAAEIYNEAGLHEKGERSDPLGSVALDVLRLFVNLIDFRTGRPRPSYHHDHGPLGPLARYDRAGAEEPAGAWLHRLAGR